MSQLLGDLLAGRNFDEPPEIRQIKKFVQEAIGVIPDVGISNDTYVVHVPSAAAAGALRTNLFKLKGELGGNKRILIRIGGSTR